VITNKPPPPIKQINKNVYIVVFAKYDPWMLDVEQIGARRQELGITQAEAARRAGFRSVQQWSGVERGVTPNLSIRTLDAIATALECDARDLLAPTGKRVSVKKKWKMGRPKSKKIRVVQTAGSTIEVPKRTMADRRQSFSPPPPTLGDLKFQSSRSSS
jgi:transcriptional regulator with XRE-family HTH domain